MKDYNAEKVFMEEYKKASKKYSRLLITFECLDDYFLIKGSDKFINFKIKVTILKNMTHKCRIIDIVSGICTSYEIERGCFESAKRERFIRGE